MIPFLNRKAFSLLETVVAMSLLLLLLMLLAEISTVSVHLWRQSERQQETCREARAALQQITQDLRSAILLPSGTNSLFFLTTLPREKRAATDLGDFCTVGYFMSSENSAEDTQRNLYRFYASSQETLQALKKGSLETLLQSASPADTIHCEQVASNIIQFQATPLWYDHGSFKIEQKPQPPSLIQLCLTAAPSPIKQTKKENEKQVFTTVVRVAPTEVGTSSSLSD